MEQMLLTPKEINDEGSSLMKKLERMPTYGEHGKQMAKAQLKKVMEILGAYQVDMGREDVDKVPMIYLRILECEWQSILKEVEE